MDLAVFGFDRAIIYANDKTALGSDLGRHLSSAGLSGAVDELLKTGRVANHSSDLEKNAVPYLAGVADEVPTLAQRAAAAAKNTEALIAKTVAKVQKGSAALGRANAAQTKADAGLEKTGQLITEISAAIHGPWGSRSWTGRSARSTRSCSRMPPARKSPRPPPSI